ncbi:DUF5362 family protein [Foetidibacter luteolus]|uniref:DUF5362 family protein n=1 Tax=Foetidibacter luteolus TaxID=2608880 RepID=UPI00129B96C2|nr:DUF5362 family protein [Foetidibacter luteolus]
METNQVSLFELHIDQPASAHLYSSAKWGKFLAIVGFVFCGLALLLAAFTGTFLNTLASMDGGGRYSNAGVLGATTLTVIYVVCAILYFFPCLFLYNYSSSMLKALESQDQEKLVRSFSQLKSCFKFLGVLTIIGLALYALILILIVVGAAVG